LVGVSRFTAGGSVKRPRDMVGASVWPLRCPTNLHDKSLHAGPIIHVTDHDPAGLSWERHVIIHAEPARHMLGDHIRVTRGNDPQEIGSVRFRERPSRIMAHRSPTGPCVTDMVWPSRRKSNTTS